MPHKDFDAARRAYRVEHEPVTFAFVGEMFTVTPDPSFGDILELAAAPEFDPKSVTDERAILALASFIKKMLAFEDRPRFDAALYKLPRTEGFVLIEIAAYIAEQSSGFPTKRPESSASLQPTTGAGANGSTDGTKN